MPRRYVLDEISDTLTPYGPIDTNESNCNIEEFIHIDNSQNADAEQDAQYEKLLQNNSLVNLQIKTRTPTNLNGKEYNSKQFFD